MNDHDTDPRMRHAELLAAEELGSLSVEEAAELADLRATPGSGLEPELEETPVLGELLVALDAADRGAAPAEDQLPAALRARLIQRGQGVVGLAGPAPVAGRVIDGVPRRSTAGLWTWVSIAALIAIVVGGSLVAIRLLAVRGEQLEASRTELAQLQERVQSNATLLADVRRRSEQLDRENEGLSQELADARTRSQELDERNLRMAERLASITSDLGEARERVAMLETPTDPEILKFRRERLLEVPDAVQIAWAPFDLGQDNPAEQRDVVGDVVWSDEREEGFLRFVGLDVNDPSKEQYQVWIIDERGMEQKVSGGVFNATAEGEVIVPIEPGIDVGRVQLFAITIEDPGGIWVPDLKRRVTVAPVPQG